MIRVLAIMVVAVGCGAGGAAMYVRQLAGRRRRDERRHKLPWEA